MREITLTVRGDTVHASRHRAGIQGEANATALVVAFDESWDGYAKKITFWDALEQNPVVRALTVDLLVDAAGDTRTYRTTIPGEPLALAGECLLVLDGYVDGTRARSMSVRLTVEEAPVADNAGEPADPTPTQAEQLQVQIEKIMGDIQTVAQGVEKICAAVQAVEEGAEAAHADAVSARQSAGNAAVSELAVAAHREAVENAAARAEKVGQGALAAAEKSATAAGNAAVSAENAAASEQGAKEHKTAAEKAATEADAARDLAQGAAKLAQEYVPRPPIIGENGNWLAWDGEKYTDTGRSTTGVADVAYNSETWCWELTYNDGHMVSIPGDDPAQTDKYTLFRDGFEDYVPGDDVFQRQVGGNWCFMNNYAQGAHHDIVEDETGKYLRLRMTEAAGRVCSVINRAIRGEMEVQFDYLPIGGNETSELLDVWLLENALRARVNYKGSNYIFTYTGEPAQVSEASGWVQSADGGGYTMTPGVWYRIKVIVAVGRVTMKIWTRDGESEPEGDFGPGITSLVSEVLTARWLDEWRNICFVFGPMGAVPKTGTYAMGLDNVMVRLSKRGPQGEPGEPGVDAYIKAVEYGYEGTEEEFYSALGRVSTATYTATVTTSWTASGDYFYQDITVAGILATDNPIVDINPGNDNSANMLYCDAMCKVFRITTYDGKIRVWAKEAISTAFPVQLKVVR